MERSEGIQYHVEVTLLARQKIVDFAFFLSMTNLDAALRLYDVFERAFQELVERPLLHQAHDRPNLPKGRYREKFVSPCYKILYTIEDDVILVVDILDVRQDELIYNYEV